MKKKDCKEKAGNISGFLSIFSILTFGPTGISRQDGHAPWQDLQNKAYARYIPEWR